MTSTQSVVAYTSIPEAAAAARELAARIAGAFNGQSPDALILFASPRYDQAALLQELDKACRPRVLVGASSAGEFTSHQQGEGLACALALRSSELLFAAGIGRGIGSDRRAAARAMTSSFRGLGSDAHPFRTALVMTDALAGHADDLVEQLTVETGGRYQFFGGGAGDDAQFRRTQVFYGTEAVTDAAVALEILSTKPLGIGVGHGWVSAGPRLRVTEAQGSRVISLNGMPAVQAFEEHAAATGQRLDRSAPIPFFLHNILGIETGADFRLRVPLAVRADGSVDCAAEVPAGAIVHIMGTSERSAVDAAGRAIRSAQDSMRGHPVQAALFFDCVATRLRIGSMFGLELKALSDQLGSAPLVGCNTHGQIARADGQFGGFHNCTAVVCLLPG